MLLSNTPVVPNSINRQAQLPSPSVALRLRVVSKLSLVVWRHKFLGKWEGVRGANGKSRRDLPFVMIVTRDVTQPTG